MFEKIYDPKRFSIIENFVSHKILCSKIFYVSKKCRFQKIWGTKNVRFGNLLSFKNFALQKIFELQKNLLVQKIWVQIKFGSPKILSNLWSTKKKFWFKKFTSTKNYWFQIILGLKKIGSQNIGVSKKFWSQNNLDIKISKKFQVPKY